MHIDLKRTFIGRDSKPIKEGEVELTLESVAYTALVNLTPDEATLGAEQKLKRGRLAQRIIATSDGIDLKAEEIVLVKACIGKLYGPWIIVQVEDMLEQPSA